MWFVYKLINTLNGKCYIGMSRDPYKRLKSHKKKTNKQRHRTGSLYEAFSEVGGYRFSLEILTSNPDMEIIKELEREYIFRENTLVPNGYNFIPGYLKKGEDLNQYRNFAS